MMTQEAERKEGQEKLMSVLSAASAVTGIGTDDDAEPRPIDESAHEVAAEVGEDEVPLSFPQRLMEILDNEEHADIITWLPHGKGFIIYKKKKFASDVLPKYFKQSKFTSFTRKLNRWGFTRITRGPETGAYYHKFFQRGEVRLCMQMSCQSSKPAAATSSSSISSLPISLSGSCSSSASTSANLDQLFAMSAGMSPLAGIGGGANSNKKLPFPVTQNFAEQNEQIIRQQLQQLQLQQFQLQQLQLQQQQQMQAAHFMRQTMGNDDQGGGDERPSNLPPTGDNPAPEDFIKGNFFESLQRTKDSSSGLFGVGPIALLPALGPLGPTPPPLHGTDQGNGGRRQPRPNAGNGRAWAA